MSKKDEIFDIEPVDHDGTVPVIMDDKLLTIATQAERRVEAMVKIRRVVLGVTNDRDWIDQNGRPYLQVSGSEKVGRVFGISWEVEKSPTIEEHEDGHFTYIFRGTFYWGGASITAEGSRSSRDPFFSQSKGAVVPPSEINRRDVRMAAYTNLLGNGITRLLGIRNLTWDDIKAGGIDTSKCSAVEYKVETDEIKEKRKEIREWLLAICLDNKKEASAKLEELTTFTGKDGSVVKGKGQVDKLTTKQVPIVHAQVKKLFADYENHFDSKQDQIDPELELNADDMEQGGLLNDQ